MERTQLMAHLLQLEKGFWDAAGTDGLFYDQHMSEKSTMILPFAAGRMNKEETLTTVRQAGKWSGYAFDNPELIEINDVCVILTYTTSANRDKGVKYTAHISSVYTQENDKWKILVHQQTPFES